MVKLAASHVKGDSQHAFDSANSRWHQSLYLTVSVLATELLVLKIRLSRTTNVKILPELFCHLDIARNMAHADPVDADGDLDIALDKYPAIPS